MALRASFSVCAGANPKAVQTFLGHSKIQTTFDVYGHLFPGSHDEVRERMDAYLASAGERLTNAPTNARADSGDPLAVSE